MYDLETYEQLMLLTNRLELLILLLIFNSFLFIFFVMKSVKK